MTDAELTAAVEKANGRVIIGLKDAAAREGVDNSGRVVASPAGVGAAKARLRTLGVQFDYEFKKTPVVVARIPAAAVAGLRHNPWVDYLEPDAAGELFVDSPQQTPWNITRVQAPSVWPISVGINPPAGIKLLIMDSGIMWTHEDFNPQFAWRCIDQSQPVDDQLGHGTHVAGIAAALNNDLDVVGVAHSVRLMSANVVVGQGSVVTSEVACSLEVARANDIFAVNMSFGIDPSTSVTDQINIGWSEGYFYAAAAGNGFSSPVRYPANLPNVMAVTATDINNVKADFANVGPELDIAAPGVDILSTAFPDGSPSFCANGQLIATCSGTSMASPHVAAAAALIKAAAPCLYNSYIRDRLLNTALVLGPANQYGRGLLQAAEAIKLVVPISGLSTIHNKGTYTWTVTATGSCNPYTFQWYRSDDGGGYYYVGSGTSYAMYVNGAYSTIDLRVEATSTTPTSTTLSGQGNKRVNVLIFQ